MAVINIGGRMPDGVKVHEFWINEELFVCASGAALEVEGESKKVMGKLSSKQLKRTLKREGLKE